MSFILDALRKSESERQTKAAPGIADARQGIARSRRGPWLPLLILLLAANAALIGWLLLRDATPAGERTVALPLPEERRTDALGDLKPLPPAIATVPAEDSGGDTPDTPALPAAVTPAPPAGAADAAAPSSTADAKTLPSLQQLVLAGLLEIQPLRIDMHVYSDDPRQRFVFVNMRKYREGERLQEGPVVETITPDGLVLKHQGRRFSLARE